MRYSKLTCRNQTHRKLRSVHKLLTAQTALPVREIVLNEALLTYFSPFFYLIVKQKPVNDQPSS